MNNNIKYSIDFVSKKSGLTKNTIRAWELRYNFLNPERTETKRRLYSDAEIEKLSLLAIATNLGFKIGNIYNLSVNELRNLISNESVKKNVNVENDVFDFQYAIQLIHNFDDVGLRNLLESAMIFYSKPTFLKKVIIPLIELIGELWKSGDLRISEEHIATATITSLLIKMRESENSGSNDDTIIVCTPSGQHHEIGALVASVVIASSGWRVIYLGSDLPAEEIAFAYKKLKSKAIVMSVVFVLNETKFVNEMNKLLNYLPESHFIIGSKSINNNLFKNNDKVLILNDFDEINQALIQLN